LSNTTEADIIDTFLLDIDVPRDSHVPLEVFIAFPEALRDPTVKERIRKWWLWGNDKQVCSLDLMTKEEMEMIFRPNGIKLDWKNIIISVFTPSGLEIVLPNRFLVKLGGNTEEIIANLSDYMFLKFGKREWGLEANEITTLRGKVSIDTAQMILENSKYTPLEALIVGLGYRPTEEVKRLYLPRILAWFKGFDGKPIHICQFTLPESGKTSFGVRSETLFNWKYMPEPPTLARLVLDARTGTLGEVFNRNGISFDEFDKWTLDTQDRRYTFDAILTGMEQGKWERGVSAMGTRAPDITRLIPIMFMGNLGDFEKLYGVTTYNTRAFFNTIFTARFGHDVRALSDRIAIIDACYIQIRIMDYLTHKVLPDSVIRGIISILQSRVQKANVSRLGGRLKRHADNVYAILKTMMNVEPEYIDSLVSGFLDMDKRLRDIKEAKAKTEVPERM